MTHVANLAIVGFGLVGRRHASAIAQCSEARLSAVVEPDATGRAEAATLGVPAFTDLDGLFRGATCDGIILATPNALHVEQGLACVAQGIPVLVEKPIATKASDAERLVAQAEASDVSVLVGHHRRHNPIIQAAKAAIEEGHIGAVRAVQATCWFYKPDSYFDSAEWRKRPGAGPVAVNLVHDIDLIRHLCGDVRSVRALTTPSARGYQNEDVAGALLEFRNGAIGTVSVSDSVVAPWSWEFTAQEYPVYPPNAENCYMIGGSHGSLSVPDLRLWSYADGTRDWWAPISSTALKRAAADPLFNQISHFAEVVRGDAAPLVSGREGLRSLEVIEALQKSASSGREVLIEEDEENLVGVA